RARDVRRREAAAVEARRHDTVVEIAERLQLRVDESLPERVHLDRLLAEEPARRVVVVNGHVQEEPARVGRELALGPFRVAARREDDEGLADRALRNTTT